MKTTSPLFGFIAGIATAVGFLPHIAVMLLLVLLQHKGIASRLLIFTILARGLGDWLFWGRFFASRMDSGENIKDWRCSVGEIILSKASSIGAIIDMTIDASLDAVLIWMAFKASASPLLTLLVFCVCQAVSAPLQGTMIYLFEKRYVRLFSMIVAAVAVLAALEVNGVLFHGSYVDVFGFSQFTKSTAILFVLGAKCLLTGITVIGKDTIARIIKAESTRELGKNIS